MYEFNIADDIATCLCYHPRQYKLLCGFQTGMLRLFGESQISIVFTCKILKQSQMKEKYHLATPLS